MLISRLFSRQCRIFQSPRRHFARIDQSGRCTALWTLDEPPQKGRWIEVTEINPLWIGQSIPTEAQCVAAERKRSLRAHLAW